MITPKNIVRHELIGLKVKVVDSKDKKLIGLVGEVVDETRNTISIETKGKVRNIIKEICTFSFKIPSGWIRIEGKLLVARPEDRIKKKFNKWV